jgi:hypothetical protein
MEQSSRGRRRESTAEMAANISSELRENKAALAECRVGPRLTAAAMAHLLLSSKELLHNLLMDSVRRLRLLVAGLEPGRPQPD